MSNRAEQDLHTQKCFLSSTESDPGRRGPLYYLHKFKKAYKVVITSVLKTSMLQWSFMPPKMRTAVKQGHIQFLKTWNTKLRLLLVFCFRIEPEYKM